MEDEKNVKLGYASLLGLKHHLICSKVILPIDTVVQCRLPKTEREENLAILYCLLGWVNLYQKFEIEKYTGCGKLILPKIKMVSLVLF